MVSRFLGGGGVRVRVSQVGTGHGRYLIPHGMQHSCGLMSRGNRGAAIHGKHVTSTALPALHHTYLLHFSSYTALSLLCILHFNLGSADGGGVVK